LARGSTLLRAQITITSTLEPQNPSFVALTNKVAALAAGLQRLKAL
jgi:hypothetical protein